MPTFVHGKGTKVLLDAYDLSGYFNSADVASSVETAETTAFGSSAKSYIVGLRDGTLSLSGLYSQDSGGSDDQLSTILGSATTPIVTVAFEAGTIGNRAIVARAHETNYSMSSPVADVVSVTADFNATAYNDGNVVLGIDTGVMLTTGNSIAFGSLGNLSSVDNGAATTAGAVANLHVTANSISGGATTIKVQASADNSTWADLITFAGVSASTTTSEQKAATGSVARYLRVTASTAGSSGSITFNVSIARF